MPFIQISEQRMIISLYSITILVLTTDTRVFNKLNKLNLKYNSV